MSEKCRNTGVCCQMAEEKDYQSDGKEASEAEYITKQCLQYKRIKTNESMFPLGTKMCRMLLMNIEIPQSTRLLRYHSLFNGQLKAV